PAAESAKGAARAACAPLRARAGEAAGRARRDATLADRLGRTRGEDPDLQLPREPDHRPPNQAHDAPARPRAAGRARRVHRSAHGRRPPPRARRVTVREARVTAVDSSPDAVALACENAARLRLDVDVREGDFETAANGWDLVVSNPPYVAPADWDTLQPEIREWEPRGALVGVGLHAELA